MIQELKVMVEIKMPSIEEFFYVTTYYSAT
jgi:hypothetical protein